MDVTGVGPHTSVCMRSSKPFILCYDIEKATLRCLTMVKNLQRSTLQYLIPGRALFLCRVWKLRTLVCPRRMCQSLVVSFSVGADASPTIMLPVNLLQVCFPFSFESSHGAFGKFDSSICTWKLSKLLLREDSSLNQNMMNVRESSNLSSKHPHMNVVDANNLAHVVVTHQDGAST